MNKPVLREGFIDKEEAPAPQQPAQTQPAPAPAQIEADTWPMRVELKHSAIRDPSKGEPIRELTFRQPTAGDINRCGNPCRIDGNGDLQVDERKMTLIMANLSGVLSPLIEQQMDARDWNTCRWKLQRFFLPDWGQVFPGSPKTD